MQLQITPLPYTCGMRMRMHMHMRATTHPRAHHIKSHGPVPTSTARQIMGKAKLALYMTGRNTHAKIRNAIQPCNVPKYVQQQ
jgi:hypothetical protein